MKGIKLSTKMLGGFSLVLILLCAVGAIGFIALVEVKDRVGKSDDVNRLVKHLLEGRKHEKNFIIRGDQSYADNLAKTTGKLKIQATETKAKFEDELNRNQMDSVTGAVDKYSSAFANLVKLGQKSRQTMEIMRRESQAALAQCEAIRADQKARLDSAYASGLAQVKDRLAKADDANRLIKWFLEARKNEKEYIISKGEPKWKNQVDSQVGNILGLAEDMKKRFSSSQNKGQVDKLTTAVNEYHKQFSDFANNMRQEKSAEKVMIEQARLAQKACADARADQKSKMEGEVDWALGLIAAASLISLISGIAMAWLITLSITRPINKVIAGLGDGAAQVAGASGQVNVSSQALAEGASQQASSIEETSASMEEMSSMTKQNAENAAQADSLTKDAKTVSKQANSSMQKLREAMKRISAASEETGKIIKTIDEIAFQTNLLALNAAVEAARAGEAGSGFAVVADEVRNLAMRAAEAAKNTSALIEENINNISNGSQLVISTDEAFKEVEANSARIAELVSEIAAASREQAQGIEQVNGAMGEMDKVTQQNATNAEESAAAAEELDAQSNTMQGFVHDLMLLVAGSNGGSSNPKGRRSFKLSSRKALPLLGRSRSPNDHGGMGSGKPGGDFENF